MLEKAVGDINMPSELEGKTENSSNGSFVKPQVEHAGQNLADLQRETPASFVKSPANGDGEQIMGRSGTFRSGIH